MAHKKVISSRSHTLKIISRIRVEGYYSHMPTTFTHSNMHTYPIQILRHRDLGVLEALA
jgi:hypothetical protein